MDLLDRLRKDKAVNPWLEVADKWLQMVEENSIAFSDDSIVPSERLRVAAYEEKVSQMGKCGDFAIEKEILPCPCIGSPEAEIWLMFKNPGCTCWDYYDFVSVQKGKDELLKDDSKSRRKAKFRKYDDEKDEEAALRTRQELAIRQLKFDYSKSGFYVFNDAFRTFEGRSMACCGTYDWNEKMMFPAKGFLTSARNGQYMESWCASKVFELDYHPYRSKRFDRDNASLIETPYWGDLVDYAFNHHKRMVFWGGWVLRKARERVGESLYVKAVAERRILVMKSQRAMFSDETTYFPTTGFDISEF